MIHFRPISLMGQFKIKTSKFGTNIATTKIWDATWTKPVVSRMNLRSKRTVLFISMQIILMNILYV